MSEIKTGQESAEESGTIVEKDSRNLSTARRGRGYFKNQVDIPISVADAKKIS